RGLECSFSVRSCPGVSGGRCDQNNSSHRIFPTFFLSPKFSGFDFVTVQKVKHLFSILYSGGSLQRCFRMNGISGRKRGAATIRRVATAPMPEEGLPTFTFTIPTCSRLQLGLQGNP